MCLLDHVYCYLMHDCKFILLCVVLALSTIWCFDRGVISSVARTNLLKPQSSVYIRARYLPIVMHALNKYVLFFPAGSVLLVIQAICLSARVVVMSLICSHEHAWKCFATLRFHAIHTGTNLGARKA